MSSLTAAVFQALPGRWTLHRFIRDHLTSRTATASGTATFSAPHTGENNLDYVEEVRVEWSDGVSDSATKRYRYSLEGDALCQYNLIPANTNPLRYDEEKMFELVFVDCPTGVGGKVKAEGGEFLCGKDLYKAVYAFDKSLVRFRLTYAVKGPSKHYETETNFVQET